MDRQEALEKVLLSFKRYYNINRDNPMPPFAAEADFSLHDEQYFLVKAARIGEADSKEFVYFATPEHLDAKLLQELDSKAWDSGMEKVQPHSSHKNSDVILIILADHIDEETKGLIPGMKHYKSYKFGFHGLSHYRLVATELSTGKSVCNRHGRDLKKLVSNILLH